MPEDTLQMPQMMLFIPYDVSTPRWGSLMRPNKMRQAFEQLGYRVRVLTGRRGRERLREFLRLVVQREPYRFCYAEMPTWPLSPVDYPVLLWLALRRIPTGVFCRDGFWRLVDWDSPAVRLCQSRRYRLLYWQNCLLYRLTCAYVFFPTETMAGHFPFKRTAALPPGCESGLDASPKHTNTFIHVGGVSEERGIPLLLQSFRHVNRDGIAARLRLVCPDPHSPLITPYSAEPWLRVLTAYGDALRHVYAGASAGVLPWLPNRHNAATLPIKLFECASFGLPVVSTDCGETARAVRSAGLGIVTPATVEGLADGIRRMATRADLWRRFRRNAVAFRQHNTWEHRASSVARLLGGTIAEPSSEASRQLPTLEEAGTARPL